MHEQITLVSTKEVISLLNTTKPTFFRTFKKTLKPYKKKGC